MKSAIYQSKFELKFFTAYFNFPWSTQHIKSFTAMRLIKRMLRVFKQGNFNNNHPVCSKTIRYDRMECAIADDFKLTPRVGLETTGFVILILG